MQVQPNQYSPEYQHELLLKKIYNGEIQIILDRSKEILDEAVIDQQFQDSSGLIRGEWFNDSGKLHTICYGTGLAISKRIVLTCAHSVFLEKKRKVCDSVTFVPRHGSGKLRRTEKIYRTAKKEFIRLQIMKPDQTFAKAPIPQDIALIYFSQDIELDSFPSVGLADESLARLNSELMISGFPSKDYYANPSLNQISFNRSTVKGKLLQINGNTIFHNLDTKTGHSGSGILGINTKTKAVTFLGVHTHKGRQRNSGVYLSNTVLKRLFKYEIEFGLFHQDYNLQIKFPETIQEEVYHSLSKEEKERLKNRSKLFDKFSKSRHRPLYKEYHEQDKIFVGQDEEQDMQLSFMMEYKEEDNLYPQKIIIPEETNIHIVNIEKKVTQNNLLKSSIIKSHNQHLDLFQKCLDVEKAYLQVFRTLADSNNTTKNDKLIQDIEGFCSKAVKDLQKMKERFLRDDTIQIARPRIPSIDEHMRGIKSDSQESLNAQFESEDEQIFNLYEEQYSQLYFGSEQTFSSEMFDCKAILMQAQRTPSTCVEKDTQ